MQKYHTGELSLRREIGSEYNKAANALRRLIFTLVIIVLIQRIPSTIKRLWTYRKYYKKREKELKYKPKKHLEGEYTASLNDLSWDVYGRVLQYLEVKDLANLSQVNKKFHALNQKDFYWEYQYQRDFSSYSGLKDDVTFKQKCISAYKQKQIFKPDQPLSKEEIDSIYGTLYILYNEMVLSIRWLPHIILIPAKLLNLVLWVIFGSCIDKRRFPLAVPLWSTRFNDILSQELVSKNTSHQHETKYKNLHKEFLSWIWLVLIRYICLVGLILSSIGCFFIWLTNAGDSLRLHFEVEQVQPLPDGQIPDRLPFVGPVFTARNEQGAQPISNRFLRYLFYLAQLIFTVVNTLFLAACFAVFPYLFITYLRWSWYEAIFGPCFILLVHYGSLINTIATEFWYWRGATSYFKPYMALVEPFVLLCWLASKSWQHVGKPTCTALGKVIKFLCVGLFKVTKAVCGWLSKVVKFICNGIWQVIQWIFKGLEVIGKFLYDVIKSICLWIWKGVTAVVKLIWKVVTGIYSFYVAILAAATRLSIKWGTVGDILLIPMVLVWMLWPLAIPMFLVAKIYFIPCGLISVILMFIGYKTVQNVSRQDNAGEGARVEPTDENFYIEDKAIKLTVEG